MPEFNEKLEGYWNNGYWGDFSRLAMEMKILASPEIKIPEEGGLEVR